MCWCMYLLVRLFVMVDRIRSKTVMLYDSDIDFVSEFSAKHKISWSEALRKIIAKNKAGVQ
jgi:hypothetical protein